MGDEGRQNGKGCHVGTLSGSFWFAGWLFTLGFVGLSFWKALLAVIIWPYYLGVALH